MGHVDNFVVMAMNCLEMSENSPARMRLSEPATI